MKLALTLVALIACGSPDESVTAAGPSHGFGPISAQGGAPTTSLAGVVDPTNPTWAGGMAPCTGSCLTALANQNRAALQAVITFVGSSVNRRTAYIPPGEYPLSCAPGQSYAIDLSGTTNVTIDARNVTLRLQGNLASSDCNVLWARNTSGIKIIGATFSQRDITNPTTSSNLIRIGDGGISLTDDVTLEDVVLTEGVTGGGDGVRIDGGTTTTTVTRVRIHRGSRFEGIKRNAIDVRPGVRQLTIEYNFFKNNDGRDIMFEDTGDGPIGQATIVGNLIEHSSTATSSVAVTLSGHGGANVNEASVFQFNRIILPTGSTAGGGTLEATGVSRMNITDNTIITNRASTGASIAITGKATDVWVTDNYVDRHTGASSAAVVQVATDGTYAPSNAVIRGNRVLQYSGIAPGVDITSCVRCTVADNSITYHAATADSGATGFMGVYCAGTATGACGGVIGRNRVKRDDQDIKASLDLATKTIHQSTVVEYQLPGTFGNTITLQYIGDSGTNAGSISGLFTIVLHFKPNGTTVAQAEALLAASVFNIKTPGVGATLLQSGDAFSATALAGAAQAGRPLAAIEVMVGTGTTINRLVLRDNFGDGVKDLIHIDGDGSAAYPEGFPLFAGNSGIGLTNEITGGVTTWRRETTSDTETIASGGTSNAKRMTFLTTSGTTAYTQADGIVDGQRHCFKVKTATSTPAGTWTPTHFADGTTHTITWSAAGGAWCVIWDATSTTYRLVSITSGVTLN